MGRMKPAALLQQSKKKKGPARLNMATLVVVGLVVILLVLSAMVLHRRKFIESMTGNEGYVNSDHEDKDMFADVTEQRGSKEQQEKAQHFPRYATVNTTKGLFTIELYGNDAPLAVENFVTHSKKGYYSGLLFHRIIKNFIIQTGDPNGDGTGGDSIWGGSFKDEFSRELTHDAYTVSMANIGEPNSNRSQFFITTTSTPHLDNKHTIFGRVVRGQGVVQAIEKVKTDPKTDKPLKPVLIHNIEIADELQE